VQTRWHESDLVGELLEKHPEDWREIKLPALAEENDLLNRMLGQALCPERFNRETLQKIKETIGTSMFEALYQQNPSPPQGNMFKKDWWKYYEPDQQKQYLGIIQSWDCAYETGRDKSFSVCQTWGISKNGFYLIHQFRDRLEYPALVRAVKLQAERYDPDRILIEYQASGRSLVQDLYERTRLPIKAIKVGQHSKESRALLVTALVEAGKVFLPRNADWLDEFLHELMMFPHSRHMDQVDALSQALNFLKNVRLGERSRPSIKKRPSTGRRLLCGEHDSEKRKRGSRLYYGPRINIAATWLRGNDTV
jgi:predicted phage terminase large subunit-like protein